VRGAVTRIAGSPAPPAPAPSVSSPPERELELTDAEHGADEKLVVPIERSPGVAMRFSFRRKAAKAESAAEAALHTSLGFEDPRFRQFVGVAVISACVFVAAAWWQSTRKSARAVTAPAPAAAPVAATTPATPPTRPAPPSPPSRLERLPSPDGVPSIDFRASEVSEETAVREPPRERSAPRPRPKRRPQSSADLKNPFR
jgi:hypothetical protein